MMLSINQKTFSKDVLESPYPVLVNFWAPWCGLCRFITPMLNKFESEYHGEIKLLGINADENFQLANSYRLKTLPTLILFEGGRVIHRIEGIQSRDELYRNLEGIMVKGLARSA